MVIYPWIALKHWRFSDGCFEIDFSGACVNLVGLQRLRIFSLFGVYIIIYSAENSESNHALIFVCDKQRSFFRIWQESAFNHYSWIFAVIAEKKLFAALFYLTFVIRLNKLYKAVLDRSRKIFTAAVWGRIKHLRSAVFSLVELILVNRNAYGIGIFIENR